MPSTSLFSATLLAWSLATANATEGSISAHQVPWKRGVNRITVDGRERTFLLDLPDRWRSGAPLLMVFHGYTGNSRDMRKEAGFTPLVARHGFIAVYPQGTQDAYGNHHFNVGYAFHDDKVNDVRFARILAARLVADLHLDRRAVFATGMSNGGEMSYLLGCQPKPFVRAIAPVAGMMMTDWDKKTIRHARTSVLAVHGSDDKINLWTGDPTNRHGWGRYLGVNEAMNVWVRGLSLEKYEATGLTGPSSGNVTTIRSHHWWTASDGAEVRLYELHGGGHRWPRHLGNADRTTAAEIWSFFADHRVPSFTRHR